MLPSMYMSRGLCFRQGCIIVAWECPGAGRGMQCLAVHRGINRSS